MEKSIYQIVVGTHTAKGKFVESARVFIATTAGIEDVKKAYNAKYTPMAVIISQVACVEIEAEKIVEKKAEQQKKTETSKVMLREGEYSYDKTYYAEIRDKDIEGIQELRATLSSAERAVHDVRKDLREKVIAQFGLKNVENFDIRGDGVSFSFHPSWFNFKK